MSRKPSKPETRIEDYLDVMTGGNAALPQPILRIEFYYAFLAGMTVELPQPILDDEKLLAKICGIEVEAPTYIPGLFPRLYAYMAKKGGQDVQVPDPILRLERYWYDYSAGEAPSVQEYTGAVPVTFIADGTPLLDYIISGNTTQSGTPTPDNPIMPEGTGERTGNLFDESNFTLVQVTSTAYRYGTSLGVLPQGKYTFNATKSSGAQSIYLTAKLNGVYSQTTISTVPFTFTADGNSEYIIRTANNTGTTWEAEHYSDIMLNTGSTPLPYEPYGYKIPISSANTTTPICLGEVQTARKIKKLVLTGEETSYMAIDTSKNIFSIRGVFNQAPELLQVGGFCTHYKYNNAISSLAGNMSNGDFVLNKIADGYSFTIRDNSFSNDTDFKQYVQQQYAAGTPVTVWYVLANEETAVVNEPLMRIGDYTDTLSYAQAGVQIPTANGSTTLDVETTVKPSEIYIKYRGEAAATLSMLSAEVSSPEAATEEVNPEETEEEENER